MKIKKISSLFYCTTFFAVCLLPSLGMFLTEPESSSENRTLAEFPSVKTEEGINVEWLEQAGDYFQDHFVFRQELVTVNALLQGKVLGVSAASGVICGKDGWLYYKDSLADYLGTEQMSDRSLFNLAHSLCMMQEYLHQRGIRFLFTVAPNKNSLYGEYMPYYDQWKASEEKNLFRLETYLEQEGVLYGDLYGVLSRQQEILYHKRDSHWNNKGAALGAEVLLDALGQKHDSYEGVSCQIRTDFTGDLDQMLYPLAAEMEEEFYYDKEFTFTYVGEVESHFDPRITTINPGKTGNLVMYRDSFGNALLPFLADAYGHAYFTRGLPYQLREAELQGADTVIVECAERFLSDRAAMPPQMEGQELSWKGEIQYGNLAKDAGTVSDISFAQVGGTETGQEDLCSVTDLSLDTTGIMPHMIGRIRSDLLETSTRIYIRINGFNLYEACPVDVSLEDGTVDSGGFSLYLAEDDILQGENLVEIMIRDGNVLTVIDSQTLSG